VANARDRVPRHDLKATLCQPIDGVTGMVNGEAGERRISGVFVDAHTVIEMCVGAISDTQALLEDGSRAGDLAGRPKQGAAQSGTLFYQQYPRTALRGEQRAGNTRGAAPDHDDIVVPGGICSRGVRSAQR